MIRILGTLLFSLLIFYAHAATFTWTGGGNNGLWSDRDNWDLNDIPKPLDVVVIAVFQAQVTLDVDVEIKRLEISNNAQLLIPSGRSLEVIGNIFGDITDNVVCINAVLVNHGTISIEDSLHLTNTILLNTATGKILNAGIGLGWIEMDHTSLPFVNDGEIAMKH